MQFKLFHYPKGRTAHGGSLSIGKRKIARPISVKESLHLVLRAERARGKYSLLLPRHARMFHGLLKQYGKRFDVKAYDVALVGNHAHLIVKARTKQGLQNFLRVFAGQTAQRITKARPGAKLSKRFWDLLVYSRIIPWGRPFAVARCYVEKNVREGAAILRFSTLDTC